METGTGTRGLVLRRGNWYYRNADSERYRNRYKHGNCTRNKKEKKEKKKKGEKKILAQERSVAEKNKDTHTQTHRGTRTPINC